MKRLLYILLAVSSLTSCLKDAKEKDFRDDAISGSITVQIVAPQGQSVNMDGMNVIFSDASSGLTYEAVADASGKATARVAYGSYIASTESKIALSGGKTAIYNGSTERIKVTPDNSVVSDFNLNLNYSQTSQIIIKEFYYTGCINPKTGKNYTLKDTYFSLYNNSGDVAYLDSLCVGVVFPFNAPLNGGLSDWVKPGTSELRDSIPTASMSWMFNGTGKSIAIQPGEEVIVCLNAINHIPICSTSIDLSNPNYYAMYDAANTPAQSAPVPGVKTLECFWKTGTSRAFVVSISSPALYIYTMGGKSKEQFILDTKAVNPNSPGNRNNDVLLIDKNLIVDGVECLISSSQTKRLRPEIDNGSVIIKEGGGAGKSVHRKIDAEATAAAGGRIVYQDTNNSSNDFEVRDIPTLKK